MHVLTVPGPVPVKSLQGTSFENKIFLNWKEPVEPNGIITQYEVLKNKEVNLKVDRRIKGGKIFKMLGKTGKEVRITSSPVLIYKFFVSKIEYQNQQCIMSTIFSFLNAWIVILF
jgi:hypothetical protein